MRTGCLKVFVSKVNTIDVFESVVEEETSERVTNQMHCNLDEHEWCKSEGLEETRNAYVLTPRVG